MKTVVIYSNTQTVGGAERVLYQISTHVDRSRWIPRVVLPALPTLRGLVDRISARGVEVDLLPLARHIPPSQRFSGILSYLRRVKPDLLYVNRSVGASLEGVVAGTLVRVKRIIVHENFVTSVRGAVGDTEGQPTGQRGLARLWQGLEPRANWAIMKRRMSAILVHHTIVPCEAARDIYLREYRYPADRTHTIHLGVDLEGIRREVVDREAARRDLGIPGDAPVLLCPARLNPQKWHCGLLEAMTHVYQEFPNAILLLAGDGPLLAELQGMVESRGLNGVVRFLGWREDMPRLLSACDVSVLPSLYETFPLINMEAMAAGRPVVASRVGGVPEAVVHSETGLLVPPGDSAALAAALVDLLAHPGKREAMGEAGKRRVEERFTLGQMMARIHAILES